MFMKVLLLACLSLAMAGLTHAEKFEGLILPEKTSQIAAAKDAEIRELHVAVGDSVKAGAVLVRTSAEVIKAGKGGVVSKVLVKNGDRVAGGQVLVGVMQSDWMIANFLVPERMRAELRLGDSVRVEIPKTAPRLGEIVFIHPKTPTGIVQVWARIGNANRQLKQGQLVTVLVE